MAVGGLITRYFCIQCGRYIDEEQIDSHLSDNPNHSLTLHLTTAANYESEVSSPSQTDYGFVNEAGELLTISMSGTDLYLTPSGQPEVKFVDITDLTTASGYLSDRVQERLTLSGGVMQGPLTLYQDPDQALEAVTLQFLNDLNATTSGVLQLQLTTVSGDLTANVTSVSGTLDDKIENVFSFGVDSQGYSTTQTSFEVKGNIIFAGTDKVGIPTESNCLLSVSNTNASVELRIYDVTNASIITTITGTSFTATDTPTIFSSAGGPLSNASADKAIWEIQLRRSAGNGTAYCHGFNISS